MATARSVLKSLNNSETVFCEVLLSAFVLLLFVQILARQLFNYSIAWSEELSTFMFVWFAYMGAVVAAKMSAHNRVTFHFQFLPKTIGKWMMVCADLLWVAFNLYMVYLSINFIIEANKFWKAQTLGISMKYVLLILPIAFSLMSVRILINLYLIVFKHEELLDPEAAELEKMKKHVAETV
jgi:TRAP-type C4-dicarboxylate transport system permease small subunit